PAPASRSAAEEDDSSRSASFRRIQRPSPWALLPSFRPQIFLQPNAYVDERPSRRLAHRPPRQCGAATDGRAVYLSRGGKGVLILDSRGADRTHAARVDPRGDPKASGPSPFGRRTVYFPRCPGVHVFSVWPRNWVRLSAQKTSSRSPVPSRRFVRTWRTSRPRRRSSPALRRRIRLAEFSRSPPAVACPSSPAGPGPA